MEHVAVWSKDRKWVTMPDRGNDIIDNFFGHLVNIFLSNTYFPTNSYCSHVSLEECLALERSLFDEETGQRIWTSVKKSRRRVTAPMSSLQLDSARIQY